MSRRAALGFLCVLLLLAGQHGALVHSIWHLRDHLPAQERQHGASVVVQDRQTDERPAESRLCDLHAVLDDLLLMGYCGGAPAVIAAAVPHFFAACIPLWFVARAVALPPSRAPPILS